MIWKLTQVPRAGEQAALRTLVLPAPARAAGPYTVGRKEDCDIVLDKDKSVSRCHAELIFDKNTSSLSIRDLKSKFGVFVAAERIVDDQAHEVGPHLLSSSMRGAESADTLASWWILLRRSRTACGSR